MYLVFTVLPLCNHFFILIFFYKTVDADKEATNNLIDQWYMGYRKFMGWNEHTVERFGNISFNWPGVGALDLQPGWNYTFTVFFSFAVVPLLAVVSYKFTGINNNATCL